MSLKTISLSIQSKQIHQILITRVIVRYPLCVITMFIDSESITGPCHICRSILCQPCVCCLPQVPQSTNNKTRQGTKKSPSPERSNGGPTLRSGRVCKPSDTSEESTEEDYDESGEEEDAQEINDEMEPEDNEGSNYSTCVCHC